MNTVFRRCAVLTSALAMTIMLGACGQWTPPAPSAPSQFRDTPSHGATISGVVNGGAGVNPLLASGTSNMTVTVVGTELSASVSVSGKFILREVPAGAVFLRFTGSGIDATVSISGGVADREMVDIAVTIQGRFARIESSVRIGANNSVEVNGPVTAVSGSCPNLTVIIQGMALNLSASTGGACADVRVGIRIKIKGTRSGNVIVVVKIEMDDDDDEDDEDDEDEDDDR